MGMLTAMAYFAGGCIRFHNDAPVPDASGIGDASADEDAQSDAETELDAGDLDGGDAADAAPPPLCARRDPSIAQTIALDTVAALQRDCRLGAYFSTLPGVRLDHFEQCMAAQIGSVLGCVRADGVKVKYPAFDDYKELCRDMKSAHAAMATTDGDYEAFMAILGDAFRKNGFSSAEMTRINRAYASTRSDVVHLKDAGPSRQTCDAGPPPTP